MKTKPTQHSVRDLRNIGITPDVLICRTKLAMSEEMKRKIALYCDISKDNIVEGHDTDTLYKLPMIFEEQGFARMVTKRLGLDRNDPDLGEWQRIVHAVKNPKRRVTIGICGKYMEHNSQPDTYISVVESLKHGALENEAEVEIKWIDVETAGDDIAPHLQDVDAIVVPGGFGTRGIEGKIAAIRHARENKLPFLGLCLGLQTAVIEYSRNVAKLPNANSQEFDEKTPHPVVAILKDQRNVDKKGGTMRVGAEPCIIAANSLAHRLYGENMVLERHRHRFEVNPKYHRTLKDAGLVLSGTSPDGRLVEMIELSDHPFFIACQFHPEFKSRPTRAHPLFRGIVEAAVRFSEESGRDNTLSSTRNGDAHSQGEGLFDSGEGAGEFDEYGGMTIASLDDIRQSIARDN
jgi:CTP synthase